ncbi:MAG TPA: hypothetical protein DHN33_00410 [Eubacteriaceae bacterium]|nr:hypothetical protein [Eubacteriaceae bacterium]
MPWTKNDYPESMKNMEEPLREKAIEIANRLLEDGYEKNRAIPIAISQAKEWYKNRGESINPTVTHHLVPDEDQWLLKSLEDGSQLDFDTKEEAMKKVKEMVKDDKVKVMVHDSKGQFQKLY